MEYSVSLQKIIENHALTPIYLPDTPEKILITSNHVNRPGLLLVGYTDYFEQARIEIIGKAEHFFLSKLPDAERKTAIESFFALKPAAVVLSTSLEAFPDMLAAAKENGVPLLVTPTRTSEFLAALIAFLNVELAPRITRHGVLVEVYGEGLLLLGDSGIGKSETAIELVKRGHRLIADDAVEIKRVSDKTLVGQAPEIIRHYVELRGIGIVDVRRLFGMGAVNTSEKIDLVINLEQWVQGKMYDRLGIDSETTDILGINIPSITIPVRPGRNLAIILEIAAMNNRQKKMGYNTAEEFNKRLLQSMGAEM